MEGNSEKEIGDNEKEINYSVVGDDNKHQETIRDIKVLVYYN